MQLITVLQLLILVLSLGTIYAWYQFYQVLVKRYDTCLVMSDNKQEILKKIEAIERQMSRPDFWNDKETAQAVIKEFNNLKDELEGAGKYDKGGYRNITFEIYGKDVYGKLKNESGVHRLVRISPFNAQQKRHTSFAMVEVIPKLEKIGELKIPEDDLKIEFAKSSGPD